MQDKSVQLYGGISKAYHLYTRQMMLLQLQHPLSTHTNEIAHQSLVAYIPKGIIYSLTNSLDTHIDIPGYVQIVGYI